MNVLVVGASGGIGAAICQAALADEKVSRLLATSRDPDRLPGHHKLVPIALDLSDAQSIASAVETIRSDVSHIDRLIVASGYLHDVGLTPEKALRELNDATMQKVLQINAVGPMVVFAALEPLLKQSSEPKILFLSAQVGSIGDNQLGGWYSYRMAKAALNQGVKLRRLRLLVGAIMQRLSLFILVLQKQHCRSLFWRAVRAKCKRRKSVPG